MWRLASAQPCTHSLTTLHWRVPHSHNPFSLSIECQMQCQQSEFRAHLWEDLYLSSLRTNHPFGWREKPGKGEKGLSKHKKKSEFHSLNCLEARKENLLLNRAWYRSLTLREVFFSSSDTLYFLSFLTKQQWDLNSGDCVFFKDECEPRIGSPSGGSSSHWRD